MTQQPNSAQISEATRTAAALVRAFIVNDVEGATALADPDDAMSLVARGVLASWLADFNASDPAPLDALMLAYLREAP